MGKVENLGLNNSQGWEIEYQVKDNHQVWEKEETQGLVKNNKGGNSIISPNKNPGVCIRQLRVHTKLSNTSQMVSMFLGKM